MPKGDAYPARFGPIIALLALLLACGEGGWDGQPEGAILPQTAAPTRDDAAGALRLFFLDALGGRLLSADGEGQSVKVLVSGLRATPDGVAVDVRGGHLYWTNMGLGAADDGTLFRANLDGSGVSALVPRGVTFTPKQLTLDAVNGALYWSDREGMRVMRCDLDGRRVQTVVRVADGASARRDAANWAVGIAVDPQAGYVYWTQKGPDNGKRGSIRRAPLALAAGQTAEARTDVEVLFDGLPEPIDLALDLDERQIYWSDRGDNTINRAALAMPTEQTARTRTDRQVLVRGLSEAIGVAIDHVGRRLYYTDLGGSVGTARLDGSGARTLLRAAGALTGIAVVRLPP